MIIIIFLLKFQKNLDEKKYYIENSDNFNLKARKRFILLNYYDKDNTQIYLDNLEKNKEHKDKIDIKSNDIIKGNLKENNKDISIEKKQINKKIDSENDKLKMEKKHLSLQFYFLYENEKSKLTGIYDIDDINFFVFNKKIFYELKNELHIFYNYLNFIKENNNKLNEKNEYFESFKKYEENEDIKKIANDSYIDFSNINYENYIIVINVCLFYYLDQIPLKEVLIREFIDNFDLLKSSKLSFNDRIRIMRFICKGFIKLSKEKKEISFIDFR